MVMIIQRILQQRRIAVCGMHEMNKYLPEVDENKEVYKYAMHNILRSLMENYMNPEIEPGKPVLLHGVYSWHSGKGVDEGNIWEIISS